MSARCNDEYAGGEWSESGLGNATGIEKKRGVWRWREVSVRVHQKPSMRWGYRGRSFPARRLKALQPFLPLDDELALEDLWRIMRGDADPSPATTCAPGAGTPSALASALSRSCVSTRTPMTTSSTFPAACDVSGLAERETVSRRAMTRPMTRATFFFGASVSFCVVWWSERSVALEAAEARDVLLPLGWCTTSLGDGPRDDTVEGGWREEYGEGEAGGESAADAGGSCTWVWLKVSDCRPDNIQG